MLNWWAWTLGHEPTEEELSALRWSGKTVIGTTVAIMAQRGYFNRKWEGLIREGYQGERPLTIEGTSATIGAPDTHHLVLETTFQDTSSSYTLFSSTLIKVAC